MQQIFRLSVLVLSILATSCASWRADDPKVEGIEIKDQGSRPLDTFAFEIDFDPAVAYAEPGVVLARGLLRAKRRSSGWTLFEITEKSALKLLLPNDDDGEAIVTTHLVDRPEGWSGKPISKEFDQGQIKALWAQFHREPLPEPGETLEDVAYNLVPPRPLGWRLRSGDASRSGQIAAEAIDARGPVGAFTLRFEGECLLWASSCSEDLELTLNLEGTRITTTLSPGLFRDAF
jgi:hypothetical protein